MPLRRCHHDDLPPFHEDPPRHEWFPSALDWKKRQTTELYLDTNRTYLCEYLLRNIGFLNVFVVDKISRERISEWLCEKEKQLEEIRQTDLELLNCDYRKDQNERAHKTSEYDHKNLVLRRSSTFKIQLNFKGGRQYDVSRDNVVLEFAIGQSASEINKTKQRLQVGSDVIDKGKWCCSVTSQEEEANSIVVAVNVPCDAIIGNYDVTVVVEEERFILPDIVFLFNPFSPDDDVYMEDEVDRDEYVMNEQGIVFVGNDQRPARKNWTFGQFEPGILDIALRLLDEHKGARLNRVKSLKKQNSAVNCSRVLSAMVNVADDNGVLVGRWDTNNIGRSHYSDGTAPGVWDGSVPILRRWNDENAGVRYGQCWVYSGVLTTVLRAIGIPARPVTNYNSAHDTECNMSIDKFYYEDGTPSNSQRSGDMLWNFHVWNEVWMQRKDLGSSDYDGWQSVDSTPQEPSSGIYQCGPAPLKAIKNGEVNIGFDTGFLFGEVNADLCNFIVDTNDRIIRKLPSNTRHVGKSISTKSPGSRRRLDITNLYKYNEGTDEEREAFIRAKLRGKVPDWHKDFIVQREGEITIQIAPRNRKAKTVDRITFTVKVKNTTGEAKSCSFATKVESMLNSGQRYYGIKETVAHKTLQAGETESFDISVGFNDYKSLLSDDLTLRCNTSVRVPSTNDLYIDHSIITLKHPKCIFLTPPNGIVEKGRFCLKYLIKNPFPHTLTNLTLNFHGLGIEGNFELNKIKYSVIPGGTFEGSVLLSTWRKGRSLISTTLHSTEMKNIKAKLFTIDVQ